MGHLLFIPAQITSIHSCTVAKLIFRLSSLFCVTGCCLVLHDSFTKMFHLRLRETNVSSGHHSSIGLNFIVSDNAV